MQPQKLPTGLPEPDPDSLEHSRRVAAFVRARIAAAGGAIPFGEFMQYALYAPGLGYYTSGNTKFGAAGDFVTAPEISPLFGRVIARQVAPVLAAASRPQIVEPGAGSGALAAQILAALGEAGELPDRYVILEVSPELAERQRDLLAARVPEYAERVEWVGRLPQDIEGVVIANEVADALPVERFRVTADGIEQQYVVTGDDGELAFAWRPAVDVMADAVAGLALPDGYVSDICLALKPWISDLVGALSNGVILLFDYGLPRREYYAADRSGGWRRCHFRHRVHEQPLVLPGIQDITAWVDFTAVADAALESGADVAGYLTQAMFLLQGGLDLEFAAASRLSEREQAELARQVKHLTLPTEMGESFKCIALLRGRVSPPPAFAAMDLAASLRDQPAAG